MDSQGGNAWPSQATLAKRALVTRRSVIHHLEIAERQGWIARHWAGRNGQGWRLTGYEATVPDEVYKSLPDKPWEADPTWERGERVSPPNPLLHRKGGESDAPKVVNGAQKVVNLTQKVVNDVHTNLPSESSLGIIPKTEGALARTASVNPFSEDEIRTKAKRLREAGMKAGEVLKALKQYHVTAEQVRQWEGA